MRHAFGPSRTTLWVVNILPQSIIFRTDHVR